MTDIIENPATGERIVIGSTTADEHVLTWELFLAPGGRVPSSHAHPVQEETFTMLAGRMRFRVGRRSCVVGPGETVRVPPGTVHSFANAGDETAHVLVETSPALQMRALLETAAELSNKGGRPRRLPNPVDLALFMRDFRREVRAPYLPTGLVDLVIRPAAWLTRRLGLDGNYRRLQADRR